MKKLSFTILILLFSICGVYAQQNNTKIRLKVEENIPTAVLSAIELTQPGLTFQQLAKLPPAIKKEKKVRKTSKPPTQLYQVLSSGKNYKKRELYDQHGMLVYSREMIRNTALPVAVRQYIGREYNGWLIKRDLVVKKISGNGSESIYYKVLLQNGKEKQRIRLYKQGEIYARE